MSISSGPNVLINDVLPLNNKPLSELKLGQIKTAA